MNITLESRIYVRLFLFLNLHLGYSCWNHNHRKTTHTTLPSITKSWKKIKGKFRTISMDCRVMHFNFITTMTNFLSHSQTLISVFQAIYVLHKPLTFVGSCILLAHCNRGILSFGCLVYPLLIPSRGGWGSGRSPIFFQYRIVPYLKCTQEHIKDTGWQFWLLQTVSSHIWSYCFTIFLTGKSDIQFLPQKLDCFGITTIFWVLNGP